MKEFIVIGLITVNNWRKTSKLFDRNHNLLADRFHFFVFVVLLFVTSQSTKTGSVQ